MILILVLVTTVCGCAAILEGERSSETLHSAVPYVRPPGVTIEVSDYEGLREAILDLIMEREDSGEILINSYDDGDVSEDLDRACFEIMTQHPVGAYAVADITGTVSRIMSHYEVGVSIEYERTKQQIDAVKDVNVSTERYLRTELLSVMSQYLDEAVFRTTMNITAGDIVRIVKEIYYQNPRMIFMLPVTAVEIFPPNGEDRILQLRFRYIDTSQGILNSYGDMLASSVRLNAYTAGGENDAEILISLAENLIAACVYDEGIARTISKHGMQNFAATAYGALVNGSAVGEGFAMAYKALCDDLGFECRVLLGYYKGMVHAWNVVSLYGYYYHIDVAMCAANGIETAFLKTDTDFSQHYLWDMANTVRCNGPMTYEDFVEIEIPEDGDTGEAGEDGAGEETGDETGEETGDETGDETGAEPGAEPDEENEPGEDNETGGQPVGEDPAEGSGQTDEET